MTGGVKFHCHKSRTCFGQILFNVNTSYGSVRVVGVYGKSDVIFVWGNLNSQRYIDQVVTPVVVPECTKHYFHG